MAWGRHAKPATGAFRGSVWGRDPRDGCAEMARGRHANPATGALGEAPCAAAIFVLGVPKWPEAAVRALPLAPS
eukprot:1625292-Pyramimonas_sp.AAC.1